MRLTVLKGLNMTQADQYAKLITRANPAFIDVKAFTPEASAKRIGARLGSGEKPKTYVPSFGDMIEFAHQLSAAGNFPILEKIKRSKDILLGCDWPEGKSIRIEVP